MAFLLWHFAVPLPDFTALALLHLSGLFSSPCPFLSLLLPLLTASQCQAFHAVSFLS